MTPTPLAPRLIRGLPLEVERDIDAVRPLMTETDTAHLDRLLTDGPDPDAVRDLVSRVRKVRLRELTVHTEVSTLRLREGGLSEDVSSVFREAVAASLDQDADQVISDLGFEERGGAAGSVRGKVLTFAFQEQEIYGHAAPEDTVLLPEGFEVRLRRGEQIIIRNAGHAFGAEALGLDAFRIGAESVVILAEEDGVLITGPATIAPFGDLGLREVEALAPKCIAKTRGRAHFLMAFKTGLRDPHACRPSKIGLTKEEHDLLSKVLTMRNWEDPGYEQAAEAARSYLSEPHKALRTTDTVCFFPARKVVTRGTAGVRTIRPQSRLTRG